MGLSIHLPLWRVVGLDHPCGDNKLTFSLRAENPCRENAAVFCKTFLSVVQAALVVGYFVAASHLCFQEKEKGGKNLSTVNLNTCRKSSWDLFQAGPTGVSPRWRWGADDWMLKKRSNSASLFPASCSSQNFSCQSSWGGHAFFWQKEHHWVPPCMYP